MERTIRITTFLRLFGISSSVLSHLDDLSTVD